MITVRQDENPLVRIASGSGRLRWWSRGFDPTASALGACLLVFLGYYFGAKIGFALTFQPHPVSVLWPPNSILLAALILAPLRLWRIIFLAAFPAHLAAQVQGDVPPVMIFCWFFSNSCEALIGASVVRYFIDQPVRLDRLRNVGIFCLGAVFLGPFLSSFLDAAFVIGNRWGAGTFWEIWRIRFFSNLLSALTLAPAIVAWFTAAKSSWNQVERQRLVETGVLCGGLIAICLMAFNYRTPFRDPVLFYIPLPFLLWAAVRFGSRGATGAILVVTLLMIWDVARGRGAFLEGRSPEENALHVQLFLVFMSAPLLFLAALIEERSEAAETLRESEALNRGVLDSLTSMIAILDRSTRITAINRAWRDAGRTPAAACSAIGVGANYLQVCRQAARAGVESVEQVIAGIEATLQGTQSDFRCEYECATPAGTLWFEMLVLPLRTKAGGVVIKHRDITRHKAIEKALRDHDEKIALAAEIANLALWTIDYAQGESWMSENGRQLYGFQPNERLSRELFLSRVHPNDRGAVVEAIERARQSAEAFEIEYRLLRPDGETRFLISRGRYLRGARGEVNELIGVAIDVTAQVKADLELREQREDLAHLSRVALMGELTASLAHELNQPLTAIASNAAAGTRMLAAGAHESETFRELLADVTTDARRAGNIIHGIHQFVRKTESHRGEVDLNEIVRVVLRVLHSDLLARATSVETKLARALPTVNADPILLQQALLNLVMNSLEAMQDKAASERRIVISTARENDLFVILSVRDRGRGLPSENPEQVFTHFYSTKVDGMGMGLTIVRSTVEAHGGELGAENVEGGARFFFRLPVPGKNMREVA